MTIGDLSSIILAISGSLSLLYIARQVGVTRQQAKGQFLISLDEMFSRSRSIAQKIVNHPEFKPEGAEWPEVWVLMSVFERINVMIEAKILEVGIVDRLHGYALWALLANDAIYQRLLATGAEWEDFIDLCRAVARHRRRRTVGPHHKVWLERIDALDKEARNLKDPWLY